MAVKAPLSARLKLAGLVEKSASGGSSMAEADQTPRNAVRVLAVAALVLVFALPACSSRMSASGSNTAASGSSTPAMDESQVRKDLSDHGYSNVSNLHRMPDTWAGSAVDNSGKPVNLDVDEYGVILVAP
jgi:hypothetical protein